MLSSSSSAVVVDGRKHKQTNRNLIQDIVELKATRVERWGGLSEIEMKPKLGQMAVIRYFIQSSD